MTTTAASRQAMGRYGEEVAERYLIEQGLVVLDRNWRGAAGEIDLVLREGDTLVVCEVKTRFGSAYGTPHQAITPVKLERLKRLAAEWVAEHGLFPPATRIDLVAILRPDRGAARIEHIRGLC